MRNKKGNKMGDLKIYDLGDYRCRYNADIFVETGTFKGEGVEYASKFGFNEIHSIEIIKELADDVEKKFSNDETINIWNGSTADVLSKILPTLNGNVIFWLDAHFPGADAHLVPYNNEKDPDLRAPLERELELIQKRAKDYNDVLIIDDLWLYEDGPFEWGTCNDHFKRCGHDTTREELVGKDSSFIYKLFDETHNFEKKYTHQGYLIITPKQ